jgi:thiamine-phosphate pyrophosphorylase
VVIPSGIVLLTDRKLARRPLVDVVAAARPDWVVLRERDLPVRERGGLADRLRALLPAGRLIVAGPDPLGGDAVHLAAWDPAVPAGLVGRSCHGVPQLSDEDYVTLSPIFPTLTKPGYGPPLGAARAARLAAAGRPAFAAGGPDSSRAVRSGAGGVPWLALGGIDSARRVAECVAAGAAGVAVLGAVLRADDPGAVVAELRLGLVET